VLLFLEWITRTDESRGWSRFAGAKRFALRGWITVNLTAKAAINNCRAGRAAKGATLGRSFFAIGRDFFIHCESDGISLPLGVYHHRRCISSAIGCILFRNDDIQHFVLMICRNKLRIIYNGKPLIFAKQMEHPCKFFAFH